MARKKLEAPFIAQAGMALNVGGELIDLQCKWESADGQRCSLKGWMSEGQNGCGPWWCSDHFWRMKGYAEKKRELPDQPRTLKEFLK